MNPVSLLQFQKIHLLFLFYIIFSFFFKEKNNFVIKTYFGSKLDKKLKLFCLLIIGFFMYVLKIKFYLLKFNLLFSFQGR
jgi:hypothetical protein